MESAVTHCDMNTKTGRSLVFLGRIGTGKTHLACSIAAELAFQKRRGLNVTVARWACNTEVNPSAFSLAC